MTADTKSNRKRLWKKCCYYVLATCFGMHSVLRDA